jgi:outer membrane protein TolC
MRSVFLILSFGILLPMTGASGAEPVPPAGSDGGASASGGTTGIVLRLTMAEAVERALHSSERLAGARSALQGAGAAVGEAMSGGLPVISADGTVARSRRELTDADFAAAALGGSEPDRYSTAWGAGVQVSQPLFMGGGVRNSVLAARARRDAAGQDLRTARQAVVYLTSRAYLDAVMAREVLMLRQSSLALARRHSDDTAMRFKAGTATKFDMLRARVAVRNQEAEVLLAENDASLTMTRLLREMGAGQEERVELTTPLGRPEPAQDTVGALRSALEHRPELAAAAMTVEAGKRTVAGARSGYLPRVHGLARWGGTATEDPFENDHFNEGGSLGLSLQWNLFDGALTRSRVASARARLDMAAWAEQGLRRDIELEVRQALLSMESARRYIESQGASLEESAEAFSLAEIRFKAGAGTELEVQDARTALELANLNFTRALYRYAVARLDLDRATGKVSESRGDAP